MQWVAYVVQNNVGCLFISILLADTNFNNTIYFDFNNMLHTYSLDEIFQQLT